MIEEMAQAFAAANADDDVRIIILAAAGDRFSSGHDIGTPEEKDDMRRRPFPKGVRGEYALSRHLFLDTTLRWRDLDKPLDVRRCNGPDRRLGGRQVPAGPVAIFLDSLGHPLRKAKESMFRSRFIGAEEAARLGFVNLVVPRDRLESETMALALEIAENDPFTLRMLKWATNAAQDAMGFSHSIRNAHSHYMVQGLDGFTRTSSTARAFRR
jgi:enoyl-CoA hydratase